MMTDRATFTWADLASLIEHTPGALEQVLIHFEGMGKIPKQLSELVNSEDTLHVRENEMDATVTMTASDAIADLKARLNVLVSALEEAREEDPATLWWFPIITREDQYLKCTFGGKKKRRVGSLASHLGLRDAELQERLKAAGVVRYKSWAKYLGVSVQTYTESDTVWVVLDEPVEKDWSHVPRDQIRDGDEYETRPSWVGRPKEGWVEGTTDEEKRASKMSRATLSMIDMLVRDMTTTELMEKLEEEGKRSRAGIKNSVVEYEIADRKFQLPCNYCPIRKKVADTMKEEVERLRNRNCCLEAALAQLQKKEAENAELIRLGSALAGIKDMSQRPNSAQADSIYAHLQAVGPRTSAHSLAQMIPLAVSAFLSNIGITEESFLQQIPNATPSDNTLRNIMRRAQQFAYQTIAKELEKGTPFALAFDKGERAGLGRFVKELTYFDHDAERVVNVRFNSDGAKGKDVEAAQSIDCSLADVDIYRSDGKKSRASAQASDGGGGGGTKEGAAYQLSAVDRCDPNVYYICTCLCHALSKALQNAVENCFGSNGLGEETFLQFLHTCWSAQEACGESFEEEWAAANPGVPAVRVNTVSETDAELIGATPPVAEAGTVADDIAPRKLQKPVLTRWWHVNTCAWQVFDKYTEWLRFFTYQHESKSGGESKIGTIAHNGLTLAKSDKLKCDLAFFCAFSRSYWARHMKWVHRIDEVAKIFGHSARLVLVRYMLMLDDLAEVAKMNGSSFDNYKSLRDALPVDDHSHNVYGKDTAIKQADDFFVEYHKTFVSNTCRWAEANLLPLAIGGTGPTATVYAQWICDIPPLDLPEEAMTYNDPSHECEVSLIRFRDFLDGLPNDTKDIVRGDYIINNHYETITNYIAEGMDMWSDIGRANEEVSALRRDVCSYMVIAKHHTQSTEQGVQDIDLCTSTGRSESDASAISTYRSLHLSVVNAKLIEACKTRRKAANQHMSAGKNLADREVRSASSRRKIREGQPSAQPKANVSSKAKSRALIASATSATPSPHAIANVRKTQKRKRQEGIDNSAKSARKKQNHERRLESETKAASQAFRKPNSIALADNVSAATAKPPLQYTGELRIKQISRTFMVPLALNELEARYSTEGLIKMGICNASGSCTLKITDLKKRIQEWADADACNCRGQEERSKCKCKKATIIKLRATRTADWNKVEN